MAIPNLPPFYDMNWSDESGELTSDAFLFFDEFSQTLNQLVGFFSQNGVQFPIKTNAQITALEPDAPNGTVWFSSTDAKLKLKTADGVIETITSS